MTAAAALVALGILVLTAGLLAGRRRHDDDLATILDLPFGERDVDVRAVTERPALRLLGAAGDAVVGRLHRDAALTSALEMARVPLSPGEYVALAAAAAGVAGAVLLLVTGAWLLAAAGVLAAGWGSVAFLRLRAARRRRRFESQLPDALTMVAGSMDAGHSFQRAVQMLHEEAGGPLAEELGRVLQEAALGGSLVDGLERMAARLDIDDLRWMVQAIRIQQDVGGRLADVLRTLADFMRAREEVRLEVRALSAEGRISAWVLGAMPAFLVVVLQASNPGYLDPMTRGWGLAVSAACVASIVTGIAMIARMVRIEV